MLDLISRNNNMSYNIRVADIFGLYSAVLISILLDKQTETSKAGKLVHDKYFTMTRDEIFNLMFIEDSKQEEIEDNLISCNILERKSFRNNERKKYYKLDIKLLEQVLMSDTKENIESFFENTNIKPIEKEPILTKKQSMINNLKKGIQTLVEKNLYEDICNWIDEVYRANKYLSKKGILINLEDIKEYEISEQSKIIQIATKRAWNDLTYAVNYYTTNNKNKVHKKKEELDLSYIAEKIENGIQGADYY